MRGLASFLFKKLLALLDPPSPGGCSQQHPCIPGDAQQGDASSARYHWLFPGGLKASLAPPAPASPGSSSSSPPSGRQLLPRAGWGGYSLPRAPPPCPACTSDEAVDCSSCPTLLPALRGLGSEEAAAPQDTAAPPGHGSILLPQTRSVPQAAMGRPRALEMPEQQRGQ